MRIAYIDRTFAPKSLEVIERANTIAADYASQGFDLTLRQLYYQFVSRGWIANRDTEYKRLGSIINDARLAGLMSWSYITDRTRNLRGGSHWGTPADIIRSAARSYAIEKWAEQATRVEVWIEKDALVGVLASVCPENDVDYFSCRGYTSQSEVWSAAQRLGGYIRRGQRVVVLHLGDHDPSGIDMSRDIEDRLRMFIAQDEFGCDYSDADTDGDRKEVYLDATERSLTIDRIALNMDQIRRYNPPPNPAKMTDSRGTGYVNRFGPSSWELDALDPATLVALIQNAVDDLKDPGLWDEAVEREESEREVLTACSERWSEVAGFLS